MKKHKPLGWPPTEVHFNPKRARRSARLEAHARRAQLRVIESPSMLELAGASGSGPFKEAHMLPNDLPDNRPPPRWHLPLQLLGAAVGGVAAAMILMRLGAHLFR